MARDRIAVGVVVRRVLPPIVLGLLCLALFSPRLLHLARYTWQEDRYSHAWFIPLVSLLWLWVHRREIATAPRRPANTGAALVGIGILLWIAAQGRSFNALAHLSMMLVLVGVVAGSGGWAFFRAVAFPTLYLVFVFPVPKRLDDVYVGPPLQAVASSVSAKLIDLFGVPVVREGNVIDVPGTRLLVEEACSGIHSLYTLAALGTAWVFFGERRTWERIVLIAATVPIAIAANVFRVTVTGLLAYYVDPALADGFFHEFGGMVVFAFGLLALLALSGVLRLVSPARPREEAE
ncbi:MAG: exosortase/archaeosortase family protein [Planctomycetota bacterium]